ncbi:glycerate kinase [Clavibacter sp. VKM Ac-2873]|uniref:glycerate kinase n=1 Tax=Clavibacter sp. VKM Ac-2873 TaxID=2783813 RepID=UPI00188DB7F4|nr:glycerate kinase [Clavibacter sp. VKM Ac-2873]MBF4617893.1 glycerate kinase [Clavibacter sp. VKM Ac-2873]
MKIVLAPDSFKESMTAAEAAAAMTRGVRAVLPGAICVEVPMADGGEGTTRALVAALGGRYEDVATLDALGRPCDAVIGNLGDGRAVIEVAAAVGIERIPPEQRDPLRSDSRGVADLIRHALDFGADHLIVGLGGSATNDAGAGLLVGLGARLLDRHGAPLAPRPVDLHRVVDVDLSGLDPRLARTRIELACDVSAPLLGPTGATAVFGTQKGAGPTDLATLEQGLTAWADALESRRGRRYRDVPGAGAAGGLGYALLALGAIPRSGVDVVMEAVGLDRQLQDADLVLTGEGALDAQTLTGKTPAGVAACARRHGVPVLAFAGRVSLDADVLLQHGFTAIVPILHELSDLPSALAGGARNLETATATALRILGLGRALNAGQARSTKL